MNIKKIKYSLVVLGLLAASSGLHAAEYSKGATDAEIKIGNTAPYTGFASVYGKLLKPMTAYYKMINDTGGINGRKINFITLDDGFNPAQTVGQTRKLVESDGVLLMSGSIGSVPALSVRKYLNDKKITSLNIASASPLMNDPKQFPYSFPGLVDQALEMNTYVDYIVAQYPDAKIAVLSSTDEYGAEYVKALKERLKHHKKESMLVKVESYSVTTPTISPQMISLKESGATVFLDMAIAKQAVQSLQELQKLDWHPTTFINASANSRELIFTPIGLDKVKGVISVQTLKDPADPAWSNDPDMKAYKEFMAKYVPDEDVNNIYVAGFYLFGVRTVEILKDCGDNLTHENILKVANSWNKSLPMLLPGVKSEVTPTNYQPFQSVVLQQFDGAFWKTLPPAKGKK